MVLFKGMFAYFVFNDRCVSFCLSPDSKSKEFRFFLHAYFVLIVQLQLDMHVVKSLLALFVEV